MIPKLYTLFETVIFLIIFVLLGMEVSNIAENINTAVHPLQVQKDILGEKIINSVVGQMEPNPFLNEGNEDYKPKPITLRPGPTVRSLDFNTGNGYPKFTDKRIELTNDFEIFETAGTVREKIETSLAEGFGVTYNWTRSDTRDTSVKVELASEQGHSFSVSARDDTSTLGSLIRHSKEADIRQRAFPKKHINNPLKGPLKEYQSRFGEKQSQWVSRNAALSIVEKDSDNNTVMTASFDRNGNLSVTVTERKKLTPDDRKALAAQAEKFMNQDKFRAYKARSDRPEFRNDFKKVSSAIDVLQTVRPATPLEETQFFQELINAHVDPKATKEKYEKDKKQFDSTGNMDNMGKAYWVKNEKRKWYQKS